MVLNSVVSDHPIRMQKTLLNLMFHDLEPYAIGNIASLKGVTITKCRPVNEWIFYIPLRLVLLKRNTKCACITSTNLGPTAGLMTCTSSMIGIYEVVSLGY